MGRGEMFRIMICIAFAVFLLAGIAFAEVCTHDEAKRVAENWLKVIEHRNVEWFSTKNNEINEYNEIRSGEEVLGYYFEISEGGWIVVPSLKDLNPVIAYSSEGKLDFDISYGLSSLIKDKLQFRSDLYKSIYGDLNAINTNKEDTLFTPETRNRWDRYLLTTSNFADLVSTDENEAKATGPLLTSRWDQNSPYNDFCPQGHLANTTVVGCVATAASQIMRYHTWPNTGVGSHSYTWDGDQSCDGSTASQTLTASFSDSYDWANMPNDVTTLSTTTERNAVAELCYEVGVAFEMDYGVCASGARTDDATNVYPDFFRYSEHIDKEERKFHSLEGWYELIQWEIDHDRPLHYRINGHSIVCDGAREIDGQKQYHINYGWGSDSPDVDPDWGFNAWFTIDNIYNSSSPWLNEYCIRYITPEFQDGIVDVDDDGLIIGQWGSVYVSFVAPIPDEYYIRIWDDDGITAPEWEWADISSGTVSLDMTESAVIQFDVRPEDSQEGFEFWLYQKNSLGLWTIIEKVEVVLYADEQDQTAPQVVSYAVNSSVATDILVEFSENMNQSTLNGSNITVAGASSGTHSCSYSFNTSNNFLTINPYSDFYYDEWVTVTIGTGVTDLDGNHMASPYSFDFIIYSDDPEPTDITVSASLDPSTVDPYGTFNASGTAIYDNGQAVQAGTAIISIQDGNTYTAPVTNGQFSRDCQAPGNSGTSNTYKAVTITVSDGAANTGQTIRQLTIRGQGGVSYDLTTAIVYDWYEESDGSVYYWSKDAFRTTDPDVELFALFENLNLTNDLDLMWRNFYPNGSQYGSDLVWDNAIPSYYDWGWAVWGWLCSGSSMAYNPGKYRMELFVDGDRKRTHYYVVAWDFVGHYLCKNYDSEWNPIDQTNTFDVSDTRAVALNHFELRAQEINVRTEWYSPGNNLYTTSDHLIEDDLGPNDWTGWTRHANWMWIDGYSPQYMCGDWNVKFYIQNPSSGAWEHKYTDYFRIEESTPPSATVSSSPTSPIETQNVTISVTANDNNHLQRVLLHWNDGSNHEYQMATNINSGSYGGSHSIGSFTTGQSVSYWVEVWDESGNRAESSHKSFVVSPEVVTVPSQPTGPDYLQPGVTGTFTTGGASTNLSHPVQYQFDWSDGYSAWGGTSGTKYWIEGVYLVKARARCQTHPARESEWSSGKPVIVDGTAPILMANIGDTTVSDQTLVITGITSDIEPSSGLTSTTINSGQANGGDSYNWQFTVSLSDGLNTFVISSIDNAGNIGTTTINVTMGAGPAFCLPVDTLSWVVDPYAGSLPLENISIENCGSATLEFTYDIEGDGFVWLGMIGDTVLSEGEFGEFDVYIGELPSYSGDTSYNRIIFHDINYPDVIDTIIIRYYRLPILPELFLIEPSIDVTVIENGPLPDPISIPVEMIGDIPGEYCIDTTGKPDWLYIDGELCNSGYVIPNQIHIATTALPPGSYEYALNIGCTNCFSDARDGNDKSQAVSLPINYHVNESGDCRAYYVAKAGDDVTGDGSYDNPYLTVQHGIDIASDCDTVVVMAGDYTERVSIDKGIVLISEDGPESTTLRGETDYRVITVANASDTVEIIGFEITEGRPTLELFMGLYNPGGGIFVQASPIKIKNCHIHDNSTPMSETATAGGGIHIRECSYVELIDNEIYLNLAYSGGGVMIRDNCGGVISGNIIDQNESQTSGPGVWILSPAFTTDQYLVENNTIFDNMSYSGTMASGFEARLVTLEMNNNIVVENEGVSGTAQVWITDCDVTLSCNDVYDSNLGTLYHIDPSAPYPTDISSYPKFCDTLVRNYTLQSTSPCLPDNNSCGVLMGVRGLGDCDEDCFTFTPNTGETYPIVIDAASFEDMPLQNGDNIGVFDGDLCVGLTAFEGIFPIAITAWADDTQTSEVDGYICGNSMTFKIGRPIDCTPYSHTFIQYYSGITFCDGPYSDIDSIAFNTEYCNTMFLNHGWNLVSSYTEPDNLDPLVMFDPTIELVNIIKDCAGNFCIPDLFCGISIWDMSQGYWIHTDDATFVEICGDIVPYNTPIPLGEGWNCIAYYPQCCLDAPTAIATVESSTNIIKDGAGGFYIPGLINAMDPMCPFEGFSIHMASQATLVYPECPPAAKESVPAKIDKISPKHFVRTQTSDDYHAIVIQDVDGLTFGDEVGVYCDNMIIGGGIYTGGPIAVSVWHDDSETEETDGYVDGDQFTVRIWNSIDNIESDAEITLLTGSLRLGESPYTILSLSTSDSIKPFSYNLSVNYPNPFNPVTIIDFSLPQSEYVEITIHNILGQTVKKLIDDIYTSGQHSVQWDGCNENGQSVASGIYFYHIKAGDFEQTKKMTLMK